MPDPKMTLMKAWEANQQANFQILQAMSDLDEEDTGFCPRETLTQAIQYQTESANHLTAVKTIIKATITPCP